LQNSLEHLRKTQEGLHEYAASEPPGDADPEIAKALEENKIVIGSQEERISILKMALAEKGVHVGSHYDLEPANPLKPQADPLTVVRRGSDSAATTTMTMASVNEEPDEDDGGIHL